MQDTAKFLAWLDSLEPGSRKRFNLSTADAEHMCDLLDAAIDSFPLWGLAYEATNGERIQIDIVLHDLDFSERFAHYLTPANRPFKKLMQRV